MTLDQNTSESRSPFSTYASTIPIAAHAPVSGASERRVIAAIKAVRCRPTDDLLAIVRRIARAENSIPAKELTDLIISTSEELGEHTLDAIRFSVNEVLKAGDAYDDALVSARVKARLDAALAGDADLDDETADVPIDLRPRPLSELTRPPGLVGEIVDFIEATAEFPSRELALGAALGFVAALAGRGFETPRHARTNLYIACLASSGFGKDHAPSCINALARACEMSHFLGPARFMSSSALRNEVMAQPSMLAVQDEYGGILRQIDGPKVGIHNEMIRYDLLGFFSRAKDEYAGAAYASARAVKIHNPNLCVLGLSTPDDFWSALSSSRSQDGFLGRYILINVDGKKPSRTKPTMNLRAPPRKLIDGCIAVHREVYGSRGNLLDKKDGSSPFPARVVDYSRGAEEVLEAFETKIGHAAARADYKVAPFWTRAYEHAAKIALTVAVGLNPAQPVITSEIMSWAADLAWASVSALCREAENRMADNDRQRHFQRIIELVRRAGANGLTAGKLTDKLGGTLDKRLRVELIEEAEETGRIASIHFRPPKGRPSFRYVASEFRPEPAG